MMTPPGSTEDYLQPDFSSLASSAACYIPQHFAPTALTAMACGCDGMHARLMLLQRDDHCTSVWHVLFGFDMLNA